VEVVMKTINSSLCFALLLIFSTNTLYSQDTPEFLIDTSIVFGYSYDVKENQAIAFDGTNYLVVWEDEYNGNINIIGTFVDQSGRVLNPHPDGIIITNGSYDHLTAAISFDGTNYLVAWSEDKNGDLDIVGTRISTEGTILDPEGIKISVEPDNQSIPSITFGGAYYFVTWFDSSDTNTICGARVSPTGEVQDPLGIIINANQFWWFSGWGAFVTSDGTNYLVCWYECLGDRCGHFSSRINQNGEILDTIEINTGPDIYSGPGAFASLAFDGENYLYVGNKPSVFPIELVEIRINQMGNVIDTISISLGICPSISLNDDHHLISWGLPGYYSDCNVYARRMDKSGVLLDSLDIQLTQYTKDCNDPPKPQSASDVTNSLVVWNIYDAMIQGTRVDKKGNVLDPNGLVISTNPNSQFSPSVASDGPEYFIVWKDTRYNIFDIYGTRIDQQGNNLNPGGVYIRNIDDEEENPKVTFGGSFYTAAWIGYEPQRNICRARIDQSGILIDTSSVAISISALEHRPSIASDGDKYLIASEFVPIGSSRYDILGLILNQSGAVLNTFPISIIENDQHVPRIAFNGSDYLVVWYNGREYLGYDVYGTLVDTNGLVLQPEGIQICIAEGHQVYPSAASDGNNYFIVWQDNLDPPTNIWGARLDSSGTLIDTVAFPISLAEGDQEYPVVAFNGNEYVVVWQDNRNGVDYDIYGAKVSTDGNVVDSFVVSNAIGDQLSPDITYSSHNQVLVVYSGWTGEYEGRRYDCMRIWGRYIESVAGIGNHSGELVREYSLEQSYPNPFNPSTTIQYSVKERTLVELVLYDILGRQLEVLVNEEQNVGYYKVNFNAGRLASGVYLYRLQAGDFIEIKKMVLLR
jgi:hypothetical protein